MVCHDFDALRKTSVCVWWGPIRPFELNNESELLKSPLDPYERGTPEDGIIVPADPLDGKTE